MKKLFVFSILILVVSCAGPSGTLKVIANGEDFIKEGFVDKTGWEINFTNCLMNLSGIKIYSKTNNEVKFEKKSYTYFLHDNFVFKWIKFCL